MLAVTKLKEDCETFTMSIYENLSDIEALEIGYHHHNDCLKLTKQPQVMNMVKIIRDLIVGWLFLCLTTL